MHQRLLGESSAKPPTRRVINVYLLGITLIVMAFCAIAFGVAVNNYMQDQYDRERVGEVRRKLDQTTHYITQATRVENQTMIQKQTIEGDVQRCESAGVKVANHTVPTELWQVYDLINTTIAQLDAGCNAEIDSLTATVQQIINASTVVPTTLRTGNCQLNVANSTFSGITADYMYKLLTLNGVDFYYYVFGASTGAVEAGNEGARLEHCSPQIFVGHAVDKPLFYLDADADYVGRIRVGEGALEFIPKEGNDYTNRTLSVAAGFQVWVGLF